MTTVQLKSEIQKAIDNVPENVLPDVLKYLNSIQQQYPDKKKLMEFADRVLKEDAEVLRRLAQ